MQLKYFKTFPFPMLISLPAHLVLYLFIKYIYTGQNIQTKSLFYNVALYSIKYIKLCNKKIVIKKSSLKIQWQVTSIHYKQFHFCLKRVQCSTRFDVNGLRIPHNGTPMGKRVLKTLKMSIWYKYIIVIHGSSCSFSNF